MVSQGLEESYVYPDPPQGPRQMPTDTHSQMRSQISAQKCQLHIFCFSFVVFFSGGLTRWGRWGLRGPLALSSVTPCCEIKGCPRLESCILVGEVPPSCTATALPFVRTAFCAIFFSSRSSSSVH